MSAFPSHGVAARADWAELTLLVGQASRLGRSQLRDAIEDSDPDLDDAEIETGVDEVFSEIRRRERAGGDLYPFARDRTAISRRGLDQRLEALYTFLALNTASSSFRQPVQGFTSGKVFEEIVALALAAWSLGTAVVFAQRAPGQAAGVRAALERLGVALSVESRPEKVRRARKDYGLDVAAWRGFPDGRSGHPVLLCQCTVGWRLIAKAREVLPSDWGLLLDMREGTFSAALAVPHVLPPDYENWYELRSSTDLIIERLRLLVLLESVDEPWSPVVPHANALANGLQEWAA